MVVLVSCPLWTFPAIIVSLSAFSILLCYIHRQFLASKAGKAKRDQSCERPSAETELSADVRNEDSSAQENLAPNPPCRATRCRGAKSRTRSWQASETFPPPQSLAAPLRLDQHYAQPHTLSPSLLRSSAARPCQACSAAGHSDGVSVAALQADASISSVASAVAAAVRGKFSGDGSPGGMSVATPAGVCCSKQGTTAASSDQATPSSTSPCITSALHPLDTACRHDNLPSAYDTARAIVGRTLAQTYTPMFTLGRVALKIPDRHPSDLPPATAWTQPYCNALESEGIVLVGAYVREGCIHIVLDILDLAVDDDDTATAGARAVRSHSYSFSPAHHDDNDRLLTGAEGVRGSHGLSSGRAVGATRAAPPLASEPAQGRISAPGLLLLADATEPDGPRNRDGRGVAPRLPPQLPLPVQAPQPPPQPAELQRQQQQLLEPHQLQQQQQHPQHMLQQQQQQEPAQRRRPGHRTAPVRVWSADAAVASSGPAARSAAFTAHPQNHHPHHPLNYSRHRMSHSPSTGIDGARGGSGAGGEVLSDGANATTRPQSPFTRRLRQSRRASSPLLSCSVGRQGLVHDAPTRLGQLRLEAAVVATVAGTSGPGPFANRGFGGALPSAGSLRVARALPPEAFVELLGREIGGGGQSVTVQMPPGGGTWNVQLGAEQPSLCRVVQACSPPDLKCISPPCVLAGTAGPFIMYAAGTDLQGGGSGVAASGGAASGGGGGTSSGSGGAGGSFDGSGGTAAMRTGGPLSVHVRYRGAYQPCRASLLGDQMPVEALSRVLPMDALRHAEVLCLELPRAPPLPGLMFVECQRDGLLGAALPVLVAPNAGVRNEVASLAHGSVQEGGRQTVMAQRFILDLGLWLDHLATTPLPPAPQPQQPQPPTQQAQHRRVQAPLLSQAHWQAQHTQQVTQAQHSATSQRLLTDGREGGPALQLPPVSLTQQQPQEQQQLHLPGTSQAMGPGGQHEDAHGARVGVGQPSSPMAQAAGTVVADGYARGRPTSRGASQGLDVQRAEAAAGAATGAADGALGNEAPSADTGLRRLFGRSLLQLLNAAEEDFLRSSSHGESFVTAAPAAAAAEARLSRRPGRPVPGDDGGADEDDEEVAELEMLLRGRQAQGPTNACGDAGRPFAPPPHADETDSAACQGDGAAAAAGNAPLGRELGVAYGSSPGPASAPNTDAADAANGLARAISDPNQRRQAGLPVPAEAESGSAGLLSHYADAPDARTACEPVISGADLANPDLLLISVSASELALSSVTSSGGSLLSPNGLRRLTALALSQNAESGSGSRVGSFAGFLAAPSGASGSILAGGTSEVLPSRGPSGAPTLPPPHGQNAYFGRWELPEGTPSAHAAADASKTLLTTRAPSPQQPPPAPQPAALQQSSSPSGNVGQQTSATRAYVDGGPAGLESGGRSGRRVSGDGAGSDLGCADARVVGLAAALLLPFDRASAGSVEAPDGRSQPVRMDSSGTELHSWDSMTDVTAASVSAASVSPAESRHSASPRSRGLSPSRRESREEGRAHRRSSMAADGVVEALDADHCESACDGQQAPDAAGLGNWAPRQVRGTSPDMRCSNARKSAGADAQGAWAALTVTRGSIDGLPHRPDSAPGIVRLMSWGGSEGWPRRSQSAGLETPPSGRASVSIGVKPGPVAAHAGDRHLLARVPAPEVAQPLVVFTVHREADGQGSTGRLPVVRALSPATTVPPADGLGAVPASPAQGPGAAAAAAPPAPPFPSSISSSGMSPEATLETLVSMFSAAAPSTAPGSALATAGHLDEDDRPMLIQPPSPRSRPATSSGFPAEPAPAPALAPAPSSGPSDATAANAIAALEAELAAHVRWPSASGQGAPHALAGRMRYMGVGLLAFALQRGWVHTSLELISGLSRLGMGLAETDAAVAAREGGMGLLHLAVIARQPPLLRALSQLQTGSGGSGASDSAGWAAASALVLADPTAAGQTQGAVAVRGPGFRWDLGARGPAGLTPLHVATALDDGGEVAWVLLECFPDAARLWYRARDDSGCTPAEMAIQARLVGLNELALVRLAEARRQEGLLAQNGQQLQNHEQLAWAQQQQQQQHQRHQQEHQPPQEQQLQAQQQQQQQAREGRHSEPLTHTPEGLVLLSFAPSQPAHDDETRLPAGPLSTGGQQPSASSPLQLRTAPSEGGSCALASSDSSAGPLTGGGADRPAAYLAGSPAEHESVVSSCGRATAGLSVRPHGSLGRSLAPWSQQIAVLVHISIYGWADPRVEWQYRIFRASSLGAVDATCGIIFSVLFLLPALELIRRRDWTELTSHCIFNAGLLGPYLVRTLAPRAFLRCRNTAILMSDTFKALLVLLVLTGVLPFPKVWANFCRGNMDFIMLCIIKPLSEQVIVPVALAQRLFSIFADMHIYAHLTYAGALVPSFVRAVLQNIGAFLLLLLLDVRARMSFEKFRSPSGNGTACAGEGTAKRDWGSYEMQAAPLACGAELHTKVE